MSKKLTGPAAIIFEATGVTNRDTLDWLEDCMRSTIFHSTLDWQTRAQLQKGAREAKAMLDYLQTPEGAREFPDSLADAQARGAI